MTTRRPRELIHGLLTSILLLPVLAALGCSSAQSGHAPGLAGGQTLTPGVTNFPLAYVKRPVLTPTTNPADIDNPLVNAKRTADKTIDVSYINQAIQLFNVQEGRAPKTLDELVPKYVAKLPDPPLGYKLTYDVKKGEASVVRE